MVWFDLLTWFIEYVAGRKKATREQLIQKIAVATAGGDAALMRGDFVEAMQIWELRAMIWAAVAKLPNDKKKKRK